MRLTQEENPDEIRKYEHIKPAPVFGPGRCFSKFSGSHRSCTLPKGHEGPHLAHGFLRRLYAVWDAEE